MDDNNEISNNKNIRPDEDEALQKIISILRPFTPDDRNRLIKTIVTFFGHHGVPTETQVGFSNSRTRSVLETPRELARFSDDRQMSPKDFLLTKRPLSDVERVAVLGFYLAHYRETPYFKTLEISKLNTEAAQRKFSNAALALNNATKMGYLVPATKGQKQLSGPGELFVQALPDRDAAKSAMTTHRRPKKPRRNGKSDEQSDS